MSCSPTWSSLVRSGIPGFKFPLGVKMQSDLSQPGKEQVSFFIQLGSLSPKGPQAGPSGHKKPQTSCSWGPGWTPGGAQLSRGSPGPQPHSAGQGRRCFRCAGWPPASRSPDAMQDTPERGKRIGVCKQCLKEKIAVQTQPLLTQVFTGGIVFLHCHLPGCPVRPAHTCRDFPVWRRHEEEVDGPGQSCDAGGQPSAAGQAVRCLPGWTDFHFSNLLKQDPACSPLPAWPRQLLLPSQGSHSQRPISGQWALRAQLPAGSFSPHPQGVLTSVFHRQGN